MNSRKKQSFMQRISWNMLILIFYSNLMVFLSAWFSFYQMDYENARNSGRNMLAANIQVVDQYFEQIDQIADAILYNEALNNVLKSETDTFTDMQVLKSIEQIYYHSRNDLRLIFYKNNMPRNAYSIYTEDYYNTITSFKTSSWYRLLQNSGQNKILLTNIHAADGSGRMDFVHSMIYRIDDLYGTEPVGYLRIDMDLALLRKQLLLDYTNIEGVEILSPEGNALFYTNQPLDLPENLLTQAADSEDMVEVSTRGSFFFCGRSEQTGWLVCIHISKAEFYERITLIGSIFLTTLFLSLTICLYVTGKNSRILDRNLGRLTDGMNAVSDGNLSVRVPAPDAGDEIDRLIIRFNEMVQQINDLLSKVEAKQALLDEAQVKALQQQINPHFIYNSLETLMGMASEGMDDEIIEICKCMSAMLRYNTKMGGVSTIREEVTQVQNYTRVLEMRMGGSFRAEYTIDPDCLDSRILKFSLQPLVENAIVHGLVNTVQGGLITVCVHRLDSEVEIRVRDNGSGIPPARLAALTEQLNMETDYYLSVMENSRNTGLLNVHLRLKLYFNDAYHIALHSELGKGTDIQIRIPDRKEDTSCIES